MGSVSSKHSLGRALSDSASSWALYRGRRFPLSSQSLNLFSTTMQKKPYIAVIGAGAFGGWTALYLLRRSARVILLDAWGPGNSRASSGGETRVIRGTYGANSPYTKMAARALQLWKEHEQLWGRQFLHPTGVLWLAAADDQFERGSLPVLGEARIPYAE